MRPAPSTRKIQCALAFFYICIVAAWSFGIEFHGAPDESTHFFLLEYLNHFHALPDKAAPLQTFQGDISRHVWSQGDFWYSGLPFPHVLGAYITTKIGAIFVAPDYLYLAARSFNWLMGGVFICALFRLAKSIGLSHKLAIAVALIVSLIPQVTFVFSYFNSDAYGLTAIALTISALSYYLLRPMKKQALSLGFCVGLLLMAKLYFLPALVFVLITIGANKIYNSTLKVGNLRIIAITAVTVAAPLMAVTYYKYGEILGIAGQLEFVAKHSANKALNIGTCYLNCPDSLINWMTLGPWLNLSLKSYFSVTGWMNVYIAHIHYYIAATLFSGLVLICIYYMGRPATLTLNEHILKFALPCLLAIGIFPSILVLSILASQNSIPQPQGRYLFATIPFLALLISLVVNQYLTTPPQTRYGHNETRRGPFALKLLFAIATWMIVANFNAWRANTFEPNNLQTSLIGTTAAKLVSMSAHRDGTTALKLTDTELLGRLTTLQGNLALNMKAVSADTRGNLDEVRRTHDSIFIKGWFFPEENYGHPRYIVIKSGDTIVQSIKIDNPRPDVKAALNNISAGDAGYSGSVPLNGISDECALKLYAVTSALNVFSMGSICQFPAYLQTK